jgi:hypothetical protein
LWGVFRGRKQETGKARANAAADALTLRSRRKALRFAEEEESGFAV